MPSVNSGPSNTQTQNISAGMVGAPIANNVGGGLLIAQSAVAVVIAPSGTIGANGALTLGTAIGNGTGAYLGGAYFYFPAGAVYSGSLANFYLVKMSNSTTVGTVYNNVYIPGSGLPTIPAPSALVPVSDPGPGAYTGVTTIQTAVQFTVPANVLGPNGALQVEDLFTWNNSAGSKTPGATWGGGAVISGSATTTTTSYQLRSIVNRGVTNSQIQLTSGQSATFGNTTNGVTAGSVDTSQPSTFAFQMTLAVATDYITLEYYRIYAFYGA